MRGLGRFARAIAPVALLIGPLLYTFDSHSTRWGTLGAICMGIGFSAAYLVLEQIAEGLRAKKGE